MSFEFAGQAQQMDTDRKELIMSDKKNGPNNKPVLNTEKHVRAPGKIEVWRSVRSEVSNNSESSETGKSEGMPKQIAVIKNLNIEF